MGKKKIKRNKDEDKNLELKKTKNKKGKKEKKKEDEEEEKKIKPSVVKVIDKKAIVDQYFSNRNSYHIYEDKENVYNGNIFSTTLNKSDIKKNNNKFYIIQLLEHDSNNSLVLFTRWGRVGVPGQHEEKNVDENSGPKLFMKKYREKTIKHSYQEIFIDYEAKVKNKDLSEDKKQDKNKKKFQNSLDPDIMDLISLIYNKKMINDNLHEIGMIKKKCLWVNYLLLH